MAMQLVAVASLLLGSAFLLIAGAMHGLLLAVRGSGVGFSVTEHATTDAATHIVLAR